VPLIWVGLAGCLIKEMGLSWEQVSGNVILAEDGTEIVEEGRYVTAVVKASDSDGPREVGYPAEKY